PSDTHVDERGTGGLEHPRGTKPLEIGDAPAFERVALVPPELRVEVSPLTCVLRVARHRVLVEQDRYPVDDRIAVAGARADGGLGDGELRAALRTAEERVERPHWRSLTMAVVTVGLRVRALAQCRHPRTGRGASPAGDDLGAGGSARPQRF